eukprot:6213830-Pleurochrysis_carterae.AAC.4
MKVSEGNCVARCSALLALCATYPESLGCAQSVSSAEVALQAASTPKPEPDSEARERSSCRAVLAPASVESAPVHAAVELTRPTPDMPSPPRYCNVPDGHVVGASTARLPSRVGDVLEHGLEPLLELAPVLGARHQRADVERDHALRAHRLGHVAVRDALRNARARNAHAHTHTHVHTAHMYHAHAHTCPEACA